MKTTPPAISIIIPARNEGQRVANAILAFSSGRSHAFPTEFVIVDDASDDGSCDGLENLLCPIKDAATIRVIKLPHWSGIPFARNTGAFAASAPILFITDANVEASHGWDIPIFRDLQPERALCGTIADRSSTWKGYGCTLEMPSMGTQWLAHPGLFGGYVPIMPEAATIMYASMFRRLGGYDTAMPVYGASEPEFSIRLWLSGAEIVAAPGIVLRHRFRPPAERKGFLKEIEPVLIQNYLRLGMLYLDPPGMVRLLKYYASLSLPVLFRNALDMVDTSDVWLHRHHLQQQLKYGFSWFQQRFLNPFR